MEKDSTKGTIIKGPWKQQSKKKVKVPKDPMQTQLQEDLIFAEELTEHLMVQLIHTMGENGFNYVNNHFNMKTLGEKMSETLTDAVNIFNNRK